MSKTTAPDCRSSNGMLDNAPHSRDNQGILATAAQSLAKQFSSEAERLSADLASPTAQSVWNRASETFGDAEKARRWMNAPREIFGGMSPQQLVDTGDPAEQRRVLATLIRIDYGVFS